MIRKVCGCLLLALGGLCLVAGTSETASADGSTSNTTECFSTAASSDDVCKAETCTNTEKKCVKVNSEMNCSGC